MALFPSVILRADLAAPEEYQLWRIDRQRISCRSSSGGVLEEGDEEEQVGVNGDFRRESKGGEGGLRWRNWPMHGGVRDADAEATGWHQQPTAPCMRVATSKGRSRLVLVGAGCVVLAVAGALVWVRVGAVCVCHVRLHMWVAPAAHSPLHKGCNKQG
eukprot:1147122-Pelagomonas_calceolata.AAC.3